MPRPTPPSIPVRPHAVGRYPGCVLAGLLLGLLLPALRAGTAPIAAGVARIDLTPPLEMKAALGGYGARESRPATGVHDAVWAKALCLRQEDRRFVLVTADVLAFPPKFKAAVLDRLAADGWTREQVLLLPSHTHTSLDMMALHPDNRFGIPQVGVFHPALFDWTADRLAQVIRASAAQSLPVAVGSSQTPLPNRNRNRRPGNSAHDPDLTVTRIDTLSGDPLAVLVNWTAHPTFMDAEDMWFSGDWPGHLQRTLEAAIGGPVVALFYNGAEGDQSPTPPAVGRGPWERAERYGRERGLDAWRAWQSIVPKPGASFATHTTPIPLPPRQWHPDFMNTGGAEYGLSEAMMREFVESLVPSETHSTALRLGDLVILGAPGELAAELGLAAKAQARSIAGARCVAIGGLADEWVSYILPPAEYARGGYEASMCFYGPTLATNLVDGMLRAAAALPPATLLSARQHFHTRLLSQSTPRFPVEVAPPQRFLTVKYPSAHGQLAAYLTPDPADGKQHPAIIWITGGDCNSIGDVWSAAPRDNDQTAAAFREAGMVMMFPSLRGGNDNPGVKEGFLGEVEDVLAAASYLQARSYVDAKRVYLGGHSTGGTLALLTAECSPAFRAVFAFGPVEDVAGYGAESGLVPVDLNNSQEVRLRSPGYWLASIQSPTWVLEGTGGNITSLRAMASSSPNPNVRFIEVKGADHFSTLAPINELIARQILQDTGATCRITLSADQVNRLFAAPRKPQR